MQHTGPYSGLCISLGFTSPHKIISAVSQIALSPHWLSDWLSCATDGISLSSRKWARISSAVGEEGFASVVGAVLFFTMTALWRSDGTILFSKHSMNRSVSLSRTISSPSWQIPAGMLVIPDVLCFFSILLWPSCFISRFVSYPTPV